MTNHLPKSAEGSVIALNFIAYIAADSDRLERFCNLSGMLANDLRLGLQSPEVQAFALDYALQDESLLLAFAADHDIKPERIIAARRQLPGYSE